MADDRIRELEIMIRLINTEIILARILACTVVYTVSYGLTRSLTVLYDRLYDYTRTSHPCQFFKSFKNHARLTRIHSNGPSVSRIRPRFIRLYVWFTRVANRVNRCSV